MGKKVFVTVGTTKFDKLIETVTNKDILNLLKENGYDKIKLQIGHGSFEPSKSEIIVVEYYRLKDSIKDDILEADLVISHSGAGSCLEILSLEKNMVAVINEDLMDNHQIELAEKLAELNLIYYSNCSKLYTNLKVFLSELDKLNRYKSGDTKIFSNYLNKCCGFY